MPFANGNRAAASLAPTEEGPLLTTIDLTAKLWFEHVHKASENLFWPMLAT